MWFQLYISLINKTAAAATAAKLLLEHKNEGGEQRDLDSVKFSTFHLTVIRYWF